jgi:hypothetical protein
MATNQTPPRALDFLRKCYELSGGSEVKVLSMDEVGEDLGLAPALKVAITEYLERHGLIRYAALGGPISITALGILCIRVEERGSTKARG